MCCSALNPFNMSLQYVFGTVNCKRSRVLVLYRILSSEAVAFVLRNAAVTFCFVLCERMKYVCLLRFRVGIVKESCNKCC